LKSFVRLYKLPADQRNAHAQFNLGVLWEQGRGGLSKDDREAARLYQLAARSRINLARRWQACGNFGNCSGLRHGMCGKLTR
jgi:TPR repeat protein